MDFLPSYLYPFDERVIEEFAVVGVSLGGKRTLSFRVIKAINPGCPGHSTWLSLANGECLSIL